MREPEEHTELYERLEQMPWNRNGSDDAEALWEIESGDRYEKEPEGGFEDTMTPEGLKALDEEYRRERWNEENLNGTYLNIYRGWQYVIPDADEDW